jgi:membrane protein
VRDPFGVLAVVAKRLVGQFQAHDIPGLGAELAYRFLFAIFPFGLFVAALAAFIASWLRIDNPTQQILSAIGDNLPPDIANSLRPELENVINTTRPGLVSIGAIAALWAAAGGTNALMKGMNRAYGVEETRTIPVRYAVAVGLTLLACVGVIASFVTVVGGSLLTQQLASQIGMGAQAWMILQVLRWPAVFLLLVVAVAVLYRFAPNIAAPWRSILVGATAFAIGWLLATFVLALYIANFSNYGATYGSLGSVIVLMLWFYLTAVLLVSGAELAAVLTKVIDPARIDSRQDEVRAISETRDADKSAKRARDTVGEGRQLTTTSALPPLVPTEPLIAHGSEKRWTAVLAPRPGQGRADDWRPPLVIGLGSAAFAIVAMFLARIRSR